MDYYSILGLSKNSTQEEIKKTYRLLAKKYHPDINKSADAEEKFKNINAAYEILGDPARRRSYDTGGQNPFGGFGGFNSHHFDMNDIMRGFGFGSAHEMNRKSTRKKTFSSENNITECITFEESIFGIEARKIKYFYKTECTTCNGYGGELDNCNVCNGHGVVSHTDGFVNMMTTCKTCLGVGKVKVTNCNKCDSKGYLGVEEDLTFKIPAGIEEKTRMVMRGFGNKINGSRGDLYININIEKNDMFTRMGNDIITSYKANVIDVLKESKVKTHILKNDYEIDLKNSFHGKRIIFKNQGTTSLNNNTNRGNLIINIELVIPELDEHQKKIINTL